MSFIRDIRTSFSVGGADKRLAIVADICTIFGVSVITLVSPLLLGLQKAKVTEYAESLMKIAVIAAFDCIVLAIAVGITAFIRTMLSEFRRLRLLLQAACWFFAIAILAFVNGLAIPDLISH